MVDITGRDINDLKKAVTTEWVTSAGEDQGKGIIDTILNRTASGKWGSSVRDVLNARGQFSDINSVLTDKKGRNSVEQIPNSILNTKNGRKASGLVDDWLREREAGAPSSIGDNLNYANPNFSDAKNLPWINNLSGPILGKGNAIHRHGTTPDLESSRPGAFSINVQRGIGDKEPGPVSAQSIKPVRGTSPVRRGPGLTGQGAIEPTDFAAQEGQTPQQSFIQASQPEAGFSLVGQAGAAELDSRDVSFGGQLAPAQQSPIGQPAGAPVDTPTQAPENLVPGAPVGGGAPFTGQDIGDVRANVGLTQPQTVFTDPTQFGFVPVDGAAPGAPGAPDVPTVTTDPTQFGFIPVDDQAPSVVETAISEVGSFGERMAENARRREQAWEATRQAAGEQSILSTAVQVIGTAIGGVLDPIGEAAVSGAKILGAAFPETSEKVSEAATLAVESPRGAAILESAQTFIDELDAFRSENPEAGRNLDAVSTIVGVLFPARAVGRGGKVADVLSRGTDPLSRGAGRLAGISARSAEQTIATRRNDFLQDLILPKQTAKVVEQRAGQARETGIGPFRKTVFEPTVKERQIATDVGNVSDVAPGKTLVGNLRAIKAEVATERQLLDARIDAKHGKTKIPRQTIKQDIAGIPKALAKEDPLIFGDTKRAVERTAKAAKRILDKHPNTPRGVLDARREFDRSVKSEKPRALQSPTETAQSIAVERVRNAMNDLVVRFAPDVDVRGSLSKQSNLLQANKNLATKLNDDLKGRVERLTDKVARTIGISSTLKRNLTAAGFAVGAATAASNIPTAITLTAIGAGGLGAFKLGMAPGTRKAISALLRSTEIAIKKSKDAPETLKQLRADRAAIIEISRETGAFGVASEPEDRISAEDLRKIRESGKVPALESNPSTSRNLELLRQHGQ